MIPMIANNQSDIHHKNNHNNVQHVRCNNQENVMIYIGCLLIHFFIVVVKRISSELNVTILIMQAFASVSIVYITQTNYVNAGLVVLNYIKEKGTPLAKIGKPSIKLPKIFPYFSFVCTTCDDTNRNYDNHCLNN